MLWTVLSFEHATLDKGSREGSKQTNINGRNRTLVCSSLDRKPFASFLFVIHDQFSLSHNRIYEVGVLLIRRCVQVILERGGDVSSDCWTPNEERGLLARIGP